MTVLAPAAFDPSAPDFGANPWPHYAALREAGICWHEGLGMWLVSGFEHTRAIASDRRMVRSAAAFASPEEMARIKRAANFHDIPYHEKYVQTSMLEIDGPDHDRMRRAVFPYFTRTRLEKLTGWINEFTEGVVADALKKGRFDFIEDLASIIPGVVIGHLMGLPAEDAKDMTRWSDDTVSFFDPDRTAEKKAIAENATREFHDYLLVHIEKRRKDRGDDLLSVLIAAEEAGTLTADETITNAMQLLHAGHGSTIDAMGNGLAALLKHPDQMQRLRDDRELMPLAVQEMFRYAAPLPLFHRFASEDMTIAGRDWAKGTKFGLCYAAANRDPAEFPDADRFEAARNPNRHIGFGSGPHVCLGNNLSRMTMAAVFSSLLDGTKSVEADGEIIWKQGLQAHGPAVLPVKVTL